jgi:hypothetical protein
MQAVYGRSVGPETKPSDSGSTGDGESAICQLPSAVLLHGVIPEDDTDGSCFQDSIVGERPGHPYRDFYQLFYH